jgi:hypothetical protein
MMEVYAVVMANVEHMAILLCASATRITLAAPAPRDAPKMPLVQSVMAMANAS